MRTLEYKVSFNTPAFLGNAEQQAQWRTPPFKALLRQWWRVVKAKDFGYDHRRLLEAENTLFGAASNDGEAKSHRSLVRLRLDTWNEGDYRTLENAGRVCHQEVSRGGPPCNGGPGRMIDANLYLGFGPVGVNGLARPPALATGLGKGQNLRLVFPKENEDEIRSAMQLAAWFGTLGSRSRNGWGALHMEHDHLKPLTQGNLESVIAMRALEDCLREEWPHAVGKDDKPLVWKTNVAGDWRAVMRDLARIKIAFRTQFAFNSGGYNAGIGKRHVLAYPVTNHNPKIWGGQERLANQIRFKLSKTADGKLEGIIIHVPCKVPESLANKLSPQDREYIRRNEPAVWQAVHAVLDQQARRLA